MVSIYKHSKDVKTQNNLSISEFLQGIKTGKWQDEILEYRTGKREKNTLPCVTASGVFKERNDKGLVQHSGFICIDIDEKGQIATVDIEQIKSDVYTYSCHVSASGGSGYAVYVKIDPDKHLEAFLGLEQYYFVNYSIVIDKSCKNISRLRYVSYDPELYVNEQSKTFKKYLKKAEVKRLSIKTIVVKSDFDEMVNRASGMNLFDDYSDYIKLAFALSSEFGTSGEHYFHALCRSSSKYNENKAKKHYQIACQRSGNGVTIASVYFKFKEAGISLTSEKTETIKSIIKLSENPKEKLKEIGIVDDENLLEKLKPDDKEKTEIDEVIDLIKLENIKFNEITRNFERNGEILNDRGLSDFITTVWQKIDDKISKDKIWTLIQSKKNTPSFNPIHDFFLKYENLVTDNEFQKLKKCFDIEAIYFSTEKNCFVNIDDYLDLFLKKWLLGIVGSSFGTYSLMILVLVGEQGIKKTEFFRNLLPQELRNYYAESNLDEGKDSEILMCKKLLIIDDEFGGKSKKDATKLKRLSSQQTFSIRAPYGRISEDLNRLAVLGGTSNDSEVINDPTGNRRIIPVNLKSFDLESFKKIDKKKLFIELYNEWKKDTTKWFLTIPEIEILNEMAIKNTEIWQEEEILQKHLKENLFNYMSTSEIKLKLEEKFTTLKTNTKRIGQAMKKLGFEQELKRIDGKVCRVFRVLFDF